MIVTLTHLLPTLGQSKCRFTKKVKIAETTKNAHAVIIIDKEANKNKDVTKLIMADENNYGVDIKIPSILINYDDGERLINTIEDGHGTHPVIAELVCWVIKNYKVRIGSEQSARLF